MATASEAAVEEQVEGRCASQGLGDESFRWLRATASPLLTAKLSQTELGQGRIGQGGGMQKQADLRAAAEIVPRYS